ncbi:MAG: caspase family protein, partial [Pseudomonadota bacterium]
MSFSEDGSSLFTSGRNGGVNVRSTADPDSMISPSGIDVMSGKVSASKWSFLEPLSSYSSSPKKDFVAVSSDAGWISLYEYEYGRQVSRIILGRKRSWVTLDGSNRFDTTSISELDSVYFTFSDAELSPYSLEVFLRDYYEPNLLGRLLSCREAEASGEEPDACSEAFKPVRPLAELNRIQPNVEIAGVRRGGSADEVFVEVEVSEVEDLSQKNGKTHTGVYDVRLFRDGQLVGQWPKPVDGAFADDLAAWREASRVEMPQGETSSRHTFEVKLASGAVGETVEFTTYAFNEDRVKSATWTDDSYTVPEDLAPRVPRAYVITVGVNAYENPERNLSFAVADAEAMSSSLQEIEGYEVVRLSLISDYERDGVEAADLATKENIREVLSLLAGEGDAERQRLRNALGKGVDSLVEATPDDLVILTFSGHGYTEQGRFYILPSDSGTGGITKAVLPKLISSEELTEWLRNVDAGEMVMIVDACHSAAGVPAGF